MPTAVVTGAAGFEQVAAHQLQAVRGVLAVPITMGNPGSSEALEYVTHPGTYSIERAASDWGGSRRWSCRRGWHGPC